MIALSIILLIVGIAILIAGIVLYEPDGILGFIFIIMGSCFLINEINETNFDVTCTHTTYWKLCEQNGIDIYVNNNELYYYNPSTNIYVIITQPDGTTFTYDEYAQEQLGK